MRDPYGQAKEYGQHIIADPSICHGELTFRGTRIFVSDVLEQVADGMNWEEIIWEWHGRVSREAIAEAVRLAHHALVGQSHRKQQRARPASQRAAK